MILFIAVLVLIVVMFGILGPWSAGMAYNWNGWYVVWFTVFNVLVMAAVGGYFIDHAHEEEPDGKAMKRKLPKNQRAYPKKGKPRMIEIADPGDIDGLQLAEATGDISAPKLYINSIGTEITFWANAEQFRKWRALRNPPTSMGEQ